MIVLGSEPAAEMASRLAYEVGADHYCCVAETTRVLSVDICRAIERCALVREHRRLVSWKSSGWRRAPGSRAAAGRHSGANR